ncbi:MAG: SRPBCC domain-containing protein [Pseudomonadota bacterium]
MSFLNGVLAPVLAVTAMVSVGAVRPLDEAPQKPETASYFQTVSIAAPATEVWSALTEKAIADEYHLAPMAADITEPGQLISFGSPERRVIRGAVLSIVEDEALEHSFRVIGGPEIDSIVRWRIEGAGPTTLVHLEHRGFSGQSPEYGALMNGWPVVLQRLKQTLETS